MSKKSKILLCVIGIFLVASILIGISYAYYIFSTSQSGSNAIITDCFRITYTDENPISLNNTIPLTDKEAKEELTPYTFTINNVCNHAIDYDVNIETLNGSTVDLNGVRVRLDNYKSQILGDIEDNDSSVIVNNNVLSSKTIKHGSIVANGSKTYNLRLYIDEASTKEQSANKTFSSKVVVSTRLNPNYSEAFLEDGRSFNSHAKQLSGDLSAITSIQRSTIEPTESDNYIYISDSKSDKPIYAWFEDGTLHIYFDSEKLFTSEDPSLMFSNMTELRNLDLSYLDTSKAENMSFMFSHMKKLESIDLSNFDTSNVTNMSGMFSCYSGDGDMSTECALSSIDVSNFDTSNVTNMSRMFRGQRKFLNINLDNFDTSSVTDMSSMFFDMKGLTDLNLDNFDTSSVTDMSSMFFGIENLTNLNISSFDTSNVEYMSFMFESLNSLTDLDLENFNTSKVINMYGMFAGMKNLTDLNISSFDTSNVTNMREMFYYTTNLVSINLSNFDTSNVTNMSRMFEASKKITSLDLSSFDTSNVVNMEDMFKNMSALTKIYVNNNWNTDLVNSSNSMFHYDYQLVGGAGTTYDSNHVDKTYAHIDGGTSNPGYFTLKTN